MSKRVDPPSKGEFGEHYALLQAYGTPLRKYLERGNNLEKGGVSAGSWVEARDRAGVEIAETWWWRYHRETRNKYRSREVMVGFLCFVTGLLTAAVLVYFELGFA